MRKLPPASDPKWADDNYRTSTLLGLCELHQLSGQDVADLTGCSRSIVFQWRRGVLRTIPAPILRALMYDLQPDNE